MPRKTPTEYADRFLDETEVSELTKISLASLRADRCAGGLGIPYYKLGSQRVRYLLSEVLAWAEQHRRLPPTPPSRREAAA